MPIIRPKDGKANTTTPYPDRVPSPDGNIMGNKVIYVPETGSAYAVSEYLGTPPESDFEPVPEVPAPNFYAADKPTHTLAEAAIALEIGGISVYYDQETDVELLLARDGQSLTIRVGTDRLELSGREWRGLYSGMMNVGPGRTE